MGTIAAPAPDAGTMLERADALAQVHAWIAEAQAAGDVEDGVVPDYLAARLDDAGTDLRTKAERAALAALHRKQETETIDAEIARLTARKQTRVREAERITQYVRLCLEIAGETKVTTPLVTVALQKNPPSVVGEVPPDALRALFDADSPFVRFTPAVYHLDKRATLDAFKRGDALPDGLAVVQTTSLRIR